MMAEDQSANSREQRKIGSFSTVDDRRIQFTEIILKLSEPTVSNLYISPEIRDYISGDEYFKYALYKTLRIIEEKLSAIGKPYQVDVKLEINPFNPKDRHSDISIRIEENDYEHILDLWNDVGSSVGVFLKSLADGTIMPVAVANRIYDFINVIFAPDA